MTGASTHGLTARDVIYLSPPAKICRKNRNTLSTSRKIEAASSGAARMSFVFLNRWKSYIVKPAKITRPTIAYYASTNPQSVWQAGGATALFIAGFGAAGYATRRDLSAIARFGFWALLALIAFGIVLIFVQIPYGDLIYSILGLVIFAGLTMFDFQRLRKSTDIAEAPLLAASIFLDVLNVFLFFLQIFAGGDR